MKPIRYLSKPQRKNAAGKYICKWCGGVCGGRRRSYCSIECEHEFLIRSNAAYMRRCVYKRDRGVCASCAVDTESVLRENTVRDDRCGQVSHFLTRCSLNKAGWDGSKSLWEADHIVPVCEGGGGCGLENIRTLCQKCHKIETAALAARRAIARREAKRILRNRVVEMVLANRTLELELE